MTESSTPVVLPLKFWEHPAFLGTQRFRDSIVNLRVQFLTGRHPKLLAQGTLGYLPCVTCHETVPFGRSVSRFVTMWTMTSFSSGLLSAINSVVATRAASENRRSPDAS